MALRPISNLLRFGDVDLDNKRISVMGQRPLDWPYKAPAKAMKSTMKQFDKASYLVYALTMPFRAAVVEWVSGTPALERKEKGRGLTPHDDCIRCATHVFGR